MRYADEVGRTATSWMDELWDDDAALLWDVRRTRHLVRETAWYAVGLLRRGDRAGAERALRSVLGEQFALDGAPYQGSFRRSPEESDPPVDPTMWVHYDPNWRQFIGTTFATIVDQHGAELPDALVDDLRRSIAECVSGEQEGRVAPTYANIALMKAWLEVWAGEVGSGEALAHSAYEAFDRHGAFLEYNSPTYYGIDLWALALWRMSSSPLLRRLGTDMEARLWRDIGRFYHAGLRNLCGPYDRAYGMEMSAHATPLGLHVWSAVGRARAPFPDTSGRFSHPHDLCFAPLTAAVPSVVEDDVVPHLESFHGERELERTLTDDPARVVTAWLGPHAMVGGWSGPASGIGLLQHAHATLHTRTGWLRLSARTAADARAEPGRLVIEAMGKVVLELEGTFEELTVDADPDTSRTVEDVPGRRVTTIGTDDAQKRRVVVRIGT